MTKLFVTALALVLFASFAPALAQTEWEVVGLLRNFP
jgi:hypothetical protein